jgi:hypothetical protein
MAKILIINSSDQICGVWQYGNNLHHIVRKSEKHVYDQYSFREKLELESFIHNYDLLIFNWHEKLFPWLDNDFIKKFNIPMVFIGGHDCYPSFENQKHIIDANSINELTEKSTPIPRPVLEIESKPNPERITIGSCGFNYLSKNFHQISRLVSQSYDDALIRLHIAQHNSGIQIEYILNQIQNELNYLNKPNINVEVSMNFLSASELVNFLSLNTINVFLYPEMKDRGLSSVIDQALASKKPFAISDSFMFRHVSYEPKFLLSQNSLSEIVNFGTNHIRPFWEKYSEKKLIQKMDEIIDKLLCS